MIEFTNDRTIRLANIMNDVSNGYMENEHNDMAEIIGKYFKEYNIDQQVTDEIVDKCCDMLEVFYGKKEYNSISEYLDGFDTSINDASIANLQKS